MSRVAAFTIGGRKDPAGERAQGVNTGDFGYGYFHGLLDELRVWNQVRNPGQVLLDMFDTACGYENADGLLVLNRDQNGVCLEVRQKSLVDTTHISAHPHTKNRDLPSREGGGFNFNRDF